MKELLELMISLGVPVINTDTGEEMNYTDIAEMYGVEIDNQEEE